MGEVAGEEVDADGGLDNGGNTLLANSNSSLTNLSIIEVFPTPMSPRNTILNLMSHRDVLSYVRIRIVAKLLITPFLLEQFWDTMTMSIIMKG